MKKLILLPLIALALGACTMQTPQAPSESRPGTATMNTAQRTQMCQVVSVRTVKLTQPYTGGNTRNVYTKTQSSGPKEKIGQVGGLVAGAALGKELGGDGGALIGALLGAAAGSAVGANQDAKSPYAFGQELIVRTTNRHSTQQNLITVTQGNSPEARPLYKGQGCYLVGTGNNVRVVGL